MEDEVDAFAFAQRAVGFERARIGVKILVGAELRGIDEVRHHDRVGPLPGDADQGEVPFVEVAHGGHESDAAPRGAEIVRRSLHIEWGFHDFHDGLTKDTADGK